MLNLRLARPMLIALAACAANFFVQGSALADDAQENKALKEQMRQMMQRMDALQKQVEALSKQQAAPPPPAYVPPPPPTCRRRAGREKGSAGRAEIRRLSQRFLRNLGRILRWNYQGHGWNDGVPLCRSPGQRRLSHHRRERYARTDR